MSEITTPPPVKAFCAVLAGRTEWLERAVECLESSFGSIDEVSGTWPFNFTDYYADQMGTDLLRRICSFDKLIDPAEIADWKWETNRIEDSLKPISGGSPERPVNLDPGYVSRPKMVLATTKNYAHRIYLRNGIYAETTLRWRKDDFVPWEWTYPDYRTRRYRDFFKRIRALYTRQLANRNDA